MTFKKIIGWLLVIPVLPFIITGALAAVVFISFVIGFTLVSEGAKVIRK